MASKKKTKKIKTKKKSAKKRTPKKVKKKTSKTAVKPKKKKGPPAVGIVTHYFPHVNAAVVKVKRPFEVGQTIQITGHTTNFTQRIDSMQVDHVPVEKAKKGDEIGLQVIERVREHDIVTLA